MDYLLGLSTWIITWVLFIFFYFSTWISYRIFYLNILLGFSTWIIYLNLLLRFYTGFYVDWRGFLHGIPIEFLLQISTSSSYFEFLLRIHGIHVFPMEFLFGILRNSYWNPTGFSFVFWNSKHGNRITASLAAPLVRLALVQVCEYLYLYLFYFLFFVSSLPPSPPLHKSKT